MRPIDADVLLEKAWDADTRIGYVQVVDVGDILDAPTVELEQKGGKEMNDPISREEAIDVLCDNCENMQAVCAHYPCKQYIAIEKLPSAQPEIIRCKDCTWFDSPRVCLRHGRFVENSIWFCADGERRRG